MTFLRWLVDRASFDLPSMLVTVWGYLYAISQNFIVAVICVLVVGLLLAIILIARLWSKHSEKDYDPIANYQEDVIEGVRWRWQWKYISNGGWQPEGLASFCTKCDTQIFPVPRCLGPNGEREFTFMVCGKCGKQYRIGAYPYDFESSTKLEIQRRLRKKIQPPNKSQCRELTSPRLCAILIL